MPVQKKIAVIFGTHDRIDDLEAHLDILDFSPGWEKIIVSSDLRTPKDRIENWKERAHVVEIESNGFASGPIIALATGIKKAKDLDIDYVIYRNCDDWCLNYKNSIDRLNVLKDNNLWYGGYNWITWDTYQDWALNENIFDVSKFYSTTDLIINYFKSSSPKLLCEFKLARWINMICPQNKIIKWKDRERKPGVGNQIESLEPYAKKLSLPENYKELYADNQRFFHKGWGLIGSHENSERYFYYKKIRDTIPYRDKLESSKEFRRWLFAVKNNLPWNPLVTRKNSGLPQIPIGNPPRGITKFKIKEKKFKIINYS